MPSLKELGTSTIVGILLGMVAVWYVSPRTNQGVGLLLVICVLIAILVGRAVGYFRSRRSN